jgi:hypothetical protein
MVYDVQQNHKRLNEMNTQSYTYKITFVENSRQVEINSMKNVPEE